MLKLISKIYHKLFPSHQSRRVAPWLAVNGDKTLRLDYDLNSESVVFDIGGYEGQWASDISAKYNCFIYIFEPIKAFADNIRQRFAKNDKIKIFNFGLAGVTKNVNISLAAESSSVFKSGQHNELIELMDIVEFLNNAHIEKISVMKINIEGSEYDLLERLLQSNWLTKIDNLQIQFHDFVPQSEERMRSIQQQLSRTHHLTYQYEFVWENWQLN